MVHVACAAWRSCVGWALRALSPPCSLLSRSLLLFCCSAAALPLLLGSSPHHPPLGLQAHAGCHVPYCLAPRCRPDGPALLFPRPALAAVLNPHHVMRRGAGA